MTLSEMIISKYVFSNKIAANLAIIYSGFALRKAYLYLYKNIWYLYVWKNGTKMSSSQRKL